MNFLLIIAASDSSGGAGMQNDIRVVSDFGYWPLSALTGITVQNFNHVFKVKPVEPSLLKQQIQVCLNDFNIKAIKIGALCSIDNLKTITECLCENQNLPIVFDPVLLSSSGKPFLPTKAINYINKHFLPIPTLITPNKQELELLTNCRIKNFSEGVSIASLYAKEFRTSVFLKGGHFDEPTVNEALVFNDGKVLMYSHPRYIFKYSHGTGCTLSTAIACMLAEGLSLEQACPKASEYVATRFLKIANEM